MNKKAIQTFAMWAREELLSQVAQRAYQYGITAEGSGEASAAAVNGQALTTEEQQQRRDLLHAIAQKGYDQVMEEVAYTWFNRFIALRFMEVNNYLPSHVRVFSDGSGAFKPEILHDVLHLDLPGLDREKVAQYLEQNQTEALYRYLLLTQCNALNEALPQMFERMGSYTELLFPNNILRPDSVLGHLVADIPEEDWTDLTIGWLYQFYESEKHDQVVNINKSAVSREDIPAATQLFTTDWVVHYIVDNSLGRYWIERHPESKLREKLEYLVLPKNGALPLVEETVTPQELTFLDPCVGSGHVLVYAFEVLMEIYKECGYSERDAVSEILQHNLFGLDIDPRAIQLAHFAVMMKARQYDRRILTRGIQAQVYAPTPSDEELWEFGSLVQEEALGAMPQQTDELSLFQPNAEDQLHNWNYRRLLAQKYTAVCTNPPYLNKYNPKLKEYINRHYKDYAGDLFSVFIYRNLLLCQPGGYCGFMSPFVWMFIKTYQNLREYIIQNATITTLIQMEYSAFEEATVPVCSFVLKNSSAGEKGLYFRLSEFKGGMEVQRQKVLEAIAAPDCGYFYEAQQVNFSKIPGSPVAYWLPLRIFELYSEGINMEAVAHPKVGMQTSNNDKYLRLWFEINYIEFKGSSLNLKWIKYLKGGAYRKWYGNLEYLLFYNYDPQFVLQQQNARVLDQSYLKMKKCTWTDLTSGNISFRLPPDDTFYDISGHCFFPDLESQLWLLAYANTKIFSLLKQVFNSTFHCQVGDVAKIVVPQLKSEEKSKVESLSEENVNLSKADWDSYETSWDFKRHPLV